MDPDIGYRLRIRAVRTAARIAPRHSSRIFKSRLNPRRHRWITGGSWEEIGELQLEFLKGQGLEPAHTLLDVGCGGMRGGIHFVRYLDRGNYFGMDKNESTLRGGERELRMAGLEDKQATLLCDDSFDLSRFARRFDYALAHSVFTHLPLNTIMRCLGEIDAALVPGGRFYATFFRSPGPRLRHEDVRGKYHVLHLDSDPYYYDPDVFRWAVEGSQLEVGDLGDWGHPRGQEMLVFTKRGAPHAALT